MAEKTFYITTPIYYPSGKPHIGTAYTTILADTIARYKRLQGYDVRFLTGLDEHGQKIAQIAEQAGITPQQHVDNAAAGYQELWKTLNISNDDFMRTTNTYHKDAVQKIFTKLEEQGDIYLDTYEGHYCTGCETYYKPEELNETCDMCQFGHPVKLIKEECYFLKLDKYVDELVTYYETHPQFLKPDFRKNEMLENFIKPGLQDLAISRTTFEWGIRVPSNEKHVVYVWLDALTNYITNLGFMSNDDALFQHYWQNGDEVVQIVGKDITRFHMIYWPIMLKALGIRLPDQILAHGFILMEGQKMSKSLGNVIEPEMLIERYGVDATRYYLMREMPYGQDGSFSKTGLIEKLNAEVVNDFANLVSRTVAMINKYFDGSVQFAPECMTQLEEDLISDLTPLSIEVETLYNRFEIGKALGATNQYISRLNKYIDQTEPWQLAKNEENHAYLGHVLAVLANTIMQATTYLSPVMPLLAEQAMSQFNMQLDKWEVESQKTIQVVSNPVGLYQRLDLNAELTYLDTQLASPQKENKKQNIEKEQKEELKMLPEITFDDFAKVDMRVGVVEDVQKHPKADRLLVFQVNFGIESRQIVSGLAEYYDDIESLKGQKVIAVVNLKPVKLRGVESCGMLLTTESGDFVQLAQPGELAPVGSQLL
ncbi:MAG: methionine--tRNA ligase [Culicoidibacterales bacterium]